MASISAEAAGKHIIVIGLSLEQTRSQYCSTEKILKFALLKGCMVLYYAAVQYAWQC